MRTTRVYCLRCLGPLPDATDLRTTCSSCGHLNFGPDRRRYWNQMPWVCGLESALKVVVVALVIAACAYVLWALRGRINNRLVWPVLAIPIFLGFKLWQTVAMLTRRQPYAHPTIFWSTVFALCGVAVLVLGESLRTVGRFGLAIVAVWTIAWVFREWKRGVLRRIAA